MQSQQQVMDKTKCLPESPQEVLQMNDEHRYSDASDKDLWTIQELADFECSPYSFAVPLFAPVNWPLPSIISQETYSSRFAERFPVAARVLASVENIACVGGAAAWPLGNKDSQPSDVDFFIIGMNPLDARAHWAKLLEVFEALRKALHKANNEDKRIQERSGYGLYQTLNSGLMTLTTGSLRYQVVLRVYPSMGALLHGVDVPSSAIAYNGKTAFTTTLGAFSMKHRVNIVNPQYRSTAYEYRLKKYFDRGFALILPELRIGALKPNNALELPHLTLDAKLVRGNMVVGDITLPESAKKRSHYELTGSRRNLLEFVSSKHHFALVRHSSDEFENKFQPYHNSDPNDDSYIPFHGIMDFDEKGFISVKNTPNKPESFTVNHAFPENEFLRSIKKVRRQANQGRCPVDSLKYRLGMSNAQILEYTNALLELPLPKASQIVGIDEVTEQFITPAIESLKQRYDRVREDVITWWISVPSTGQYNVLLHAKIETPTQWYGEANLKDEKSPLPPEDMKEVQLLSLQARQHIYAQDRDRELKSATKDCCICREPIHVGDPNTATLHCKHTFHVSSGGSTDCGGIKAWLAAQAEMDQPARCPMCRDYLD